MAGILSFFSRQFTSGIAAAEADAASSGRDEKALMDGGDSAVRGNVVPAFARQLLDGTLAIEPLSLVEEVAELHH